jgi:hypothetical protein
MMTGKIKKQEIQKPQERRVITKKNKCFESKIFRGYSGVRKTPH